jgi:hypothetical protein
MHHPVRNGGLGASSDCRPQVLGDCDRSMKDTRSQVLFMDRAQQNHASYCLKRSIVGLVAQRSQGGLLILKWHPRLIWGFSQRSGPGCVFRGTIRVTRSSLSIELTRAAISSDVPTIGRTGCMTLFRSVGSELHISSAAVLLLNPNATRTFSSELTILISCVSVQASRAPMLMFFLLVISQYPRTCT